MAIAAKRGARAMRVAATTAAVLVGIAGCATSNTPTREAQGKQGEIREEIAEVEARREQLRSIRQSVVHEVGHPYFGRTLRARGPQATLPEKLQEPQRRYDVKVVGGELGPHGRSLLIEAVERELAVRFTVDPDIFPVLREADPETLRILLPVMSEQMIEIAIDRVSTALGTTPMETTGVTALSTMSVVEGDEGGTPLGATAATVLDTARGSMSNSEASTGMSEFLRGGYRRGPLERAFEINNASAAQVIDAAIHALGFRTWRYHNGEVLMGLWVRTDYRIPTIKGGVSETLNDEISSVVSHTCGACFHHVQPQLRIIQVYADPLYQAELDERMQRLTDRLNTQLLVEFDIYRLTREVKSDRSLDLNLVAKGKDFGLSLIGGVTGGMLTINDADGFGEGDNSAIWQLLASVSDEMQVSRLSGLMHPGLSYEFSDRTELTIRVAGKTESTGSGDEKVEVSEDIIEKFEEGFEGTLKPEILEMGAVRLYYDITLDDVDTDETGVATMGERSDDSEATRAKTSKRKFTNEVTVQRGTRLLLNAYSKVRSRTVERGTLETDVWLPGGGAKTISHTVIDYLLSIRVSRIEIETTG